MPDFDAILNATLPLDSGSKAPSKPSSKPSSKTVEEILKITYRDRPKLFHHYGKTGEGHENQCIGYGEGPVCKRFS